MSGHIRKTCPSTSHFTRGDDLSPHGVNTLHAVASGLNSNSRKVLDWYTTNERLTALLGAS